MTDPVGAKLVPSLARPVTAGPSVTRPAKHATATIPIVMTNDRDPVGSGFVASLARPGGNVTGLSSLARELSGKRVELLREILPNLSRVAILGTFDIPGNAPERPNKPQPRSACKLSILTYEVQRTSNAHSEPRRNGEPTPVWC